MDIGKAFGFVFEDENWITKVLIGGLFFLLSFVLIGIPFVLGYLIEVTRRVAEGDPTPLPDWTDLGDKFMKGLLLLLINFIYMLPVILVSCLTGIMGAMAEGEVADVMATLSMCLNCLMGIWGLLVGLFYPAVIIRFALTGTLGSAFQFGEIFGFITANLGNYIIALLLGWVAILIGLLVGVIACGVGYLFTGFWAGLVTAHLWGQVYRASAAQV